MKKMRIKNNEVNEIVEGLKVAAAAAVMFIAMVIAIPAKIVLLVAKSLDATAQKLAGGKDAEVITNVDNDRDIIKEIADV